MQNEVAKHGILDRLGEIALLAGRLEGVYAHFRFAGHKDVLETIKANRNYFEEVK
jgi:UDP-3-O-acyl-N-acetylglucosamine deacetylase